MANRRLLLCFLLSLPLATEILVGGEAQPTHGASTSIHQWEYITYPMVDLPDQKPPLSFMVGYGEKSQGLRLDVQTSSAGQLPEIFAKHLVSAELHRPDGTVVERLQGKGMVDRPVGLGGGGFTDWGLIFYFPWSTNNLEEAWIKVAVAEEQYWIEVPYGFTDDPQRIRPPEEQRGNPKSAPKTNHPGKSEHLVRWSNVHYHLGKIQNGWRLSVVQSNPFDGKTEVVLYRDDHIVPGPLYLWDLHSPRTEVRVTDANGTVINGHCMDIRLHDDGMRRSDTFELSRYVTGDAVRTWGILEVRVDDQSYHLLIPSSVYKYTHGHAVSE
jgi:hypothetical protein